jgi:xanthine dehydrogenase small subunit
VATKKRDHIIFYLNGVRTEVKGPEAFLPLSSLLRYELCKTGTKVVCAEGDCGACSVLVTFPERKKAKDLPDFRMMNSCIAPAYLLDGASIVTVEGLKKEGELNEVQKKMVECFGSQCGFCTPGFVVALSGMFEAKKKITEQDAKNYTTGNLCRCTGYQPIINAAMAVDPAKMEPLSKRYLTAAIKKDLLQVSKTGFEVSTPLKRVHGPTTLKEATQIIAKNKNARIISSATDLGVQYNKERIELEYMVTLHHIPELFECKLVKNNIFVGAKVDLSTLQKVMKPLIPSFAEFLRVFASPQIRNVATLVGNIANASPIADTIPFLFVMDAKLQIQSARGQRTVPINSFYKGYKLLDMKPGEWISGVLIPKLEKDSRLYLYKVSQRRDLDISTVNAGFFVKGKKNIEDIRIAYGGVGPTVLRLPKTEEFVKQNFTNNMFPQVSELLHSEMTPQSDLRGSEKFRRKVSENLLKKFYLEETGQL